MNIFVIIARLRLIAQDAQETQGRKCAHDERNRATTFVLRGYLIELRSVYWTRPSAN
ncbi:MAG TPA: hypothetical protein V6D17_12960 [Candidatus Obscuribacterales bacterium]